MCMVLLAAVSCPERAPAQQAAMAREYKVKVAYIYNFTRYVKWPKRAFSNDQSPFVIAVFGADPLGSTLDKLQKRKASGRPIITRRYQSLDEVGQAHILFIAGPRDESVDELLAGQLGNKPILVVCQQPGLGVSGAPVNFFLDNDGTVGFELNVDAIQRRGLSADAQLMNIARVVRDGGKQ